MINRNDFLFTLVPQRDRRQHPDRRAIWRGSRRAADSEFASPLALGAASIAWTPPLDEPGLVVEKRILH